MENINILKNLFFFKDLNTIELAKVNTIIHTPVYEAGDVVIREGEKSHSLYVIKEGSVTISKGGQTITSLGAGELVGEISFLDGGAPSASVTANTGTTLIEIKGQPFEELLADHKELAFKVMKSINQALCHKLRNADDLISKRQLLLLPTCY